VSRFENAPAETGSGPLVEVTQVVRFAAAHRMHNPSLSAVENRRLYGRCNHVSGHGHTYRVAVTLRGRISEETGCLEDRDRLSHVVRNRVLERFDHANLDDLVTPQDGVTSTTEVVTGVLWRLLDEVLPPGRLVRLRVEETPNNFFEVDRGDRG